MTILTVSARRRQPPYPTPGLLTKCTIPTYEGSGKSVHPSVVDMVAETGARWHGYRWWMVDTPYPNNDDDYENPSIFASNDRVVWEVPPGVVNPIAPAPANLSSWNSDCELVWDAAASTMHAFWRTNFGGEFLGHATSTNGADWPHSPGWHQYADGAHPFMSPAISLGPDGLWHKMVFGSTYTDPDMWTAAGLDGPWTNLGRISITGGNAAQLGKRHGDMIRHGGRWLAIYSDQTAVPSAMRVMVATDDTAMTWVLSETNVLPGYSWYRPTILASTEPGYLDVWSSVAGSEVYYTRLPDSTWLDLLT